MLIVICFNNSDLNLKNLEISCKEINYTIDIDNYIIDTKGVKKCDRFIILRIFLIVRVFNILGYYRYLYSLV